MFTMQTSTMDPDQSSDQTAPKGAVGSEPIVFA